MINGDYVNWSELDSPSWKENFMLVRILEVQCDSGASSEWQNLLGESGIDRRSE